MRQDEVGNFETWSHDTVRDPERVMSCWSMDAASGPLSYATMTKGAALIATQVTAPTSICRVSCPHPRASVGWLEEIADSRRVASSACHRHLQSLVSNVGNKWLLWGVLSPL